MSVIVALLLMWFGLFSATGPTEAGTGAPEPAPDAPAVAEEFPAGLGPLRTDAAVAQRFATRYPIEACAVARTALAPELSDEAVAAYACLQEAADAGAGAEIVLATAHPAGGTAYVYYRVNSGGPLEVFSDLREVDQPGRDWRYLRCAPGEDIGRQPCAS